MTNCREVTRERKKEFGLLVALNCEKVNIRGKLMEEKSFFSKDDDA